MPSPVAVRLRRNVARSIRAGHPWVYAEAVAAPSGLPAGSVVDVLDAAGRFLARGIWDPGSPIAVRVFSRDPSAAIDRSFVAGRFRAAAESRAATLDLATTDAYRAVHGEADGLPGVICDRYADTAVLAFDGDGPAALRPWVVEAAGALDGVRRVVERRTKRAGSPRKPPETSAVVLAGDAPPAPLLVTEHGMRLEADVVAGHKTGLYLDQRENRRRVGLLADGRRTLNLFSYTGGFTVAAALGGATATASVDVSRPALDAARRNLARNGIEAGDRHRLIATDAFEFLAEAGARRERWELIVSDPPSFAPNRAARPKAIAAYRRLHAALLGLAAPGARILACSCSSHVD